VRITERDVRLLRDIALSHVLSRDQIMALGYFTSVSRCNRRMASLVASGYVRVLTTPFHRQSLYVVGTNAGDIVGERIAAILSGRASTPRYLQHALATTEVRLALLRDGGDWRFEQQLWAEFVWGGSRHQVRPDGLHRHETCVKFVEVDLGHVAPSKFARKLLGYQTYRASGAFEAAYEQDLFTVLTVTTTPARRRRLASLAPRNLPTEVLTFDELGIATPGGWS